jgi:hypothetical protein
VLDDVEAIGVQKDRDVFAGVTDLPRFADPHVVRQTLRQVFQLIAQCLLETDHVGAEFVHHLERRASAVPPPVAAGRVDLRVQSDVEGQESDRFCSVHRLAAYRSSVVANSASRSITPFCTGT